MAKIIEFAPRSRLDVVEHLIPRFARAVLGCDALPLLTDESHLTDFIEFDFRHSGYVVHYKDGRPDRRVAPTKTKEERRRDASSQLEAMYTRIEAEYFRDVRPVGVVIVDILEYLNLSGVSE
jgi:hypothetical protein